ncbi:MAG: PD40 domain-containing protein [Candidatus Schekmanbacteria bacterium]|nr:PD40 domain-containing protein [Candidatus Schekmanbacteria bacterium]
MSACVRCGQMGVVALLTFMAVDANAADPVLFVSDRDQKANWDIYGMNPDGSSIQRLSDSPSIENHPGLSPDGQSVVFSSDLSGNFEAYRAPLAALANEDAWIKLTDFGCAGGDDQLRCTPARHPEWSPDALTIIYTAKDGCCHSTKKIVSQCSVPTPILDPCGDPLQPGERYERMHVIDANGANDRVIDTVTLGGGNCDAPTVFHAGHPSFSPDGGKIIFTGATDRTGTDWEVFVADWSGSGIASLRQITLGSTYPPNPNPIRMTGGAHFSDDGQDILFSSTRTWKGNSQLFRIPNWASEPPQQPVGHDPAATSVTRLTWHCGNDYVPHPTSSAGAPGSLRNGDAIVFTSDAAADWNNPQDLDVWVMNPDGSERADLTSNNAASEMQLIADEVSWFCGLPRNLSPCVFIPRAVTIESKYIMEMDPYFSFLPDDFPNKEKYPVYMNALGQYMQHNYPEYSEQIGSLFAMYEKADNDFDGLANEDPTADGVDNDADGQDGEDSPSVADTAAPTHQVVIPSFMPPVGEGTWCPECVPCNQCIVVETACPLPAGTVGQSYNASLQANEAGVTWRIVRGALPAGLGLSNGAIAGAPTLAGTFAFGLAAHDANGNADAKDCSLTVEPAAATPATTVWGVAALAVLVGAGAWRRARPRRMLS